MIREQPYWGHADFFRTDKEFTMMEHIKKVWGYMLTILILVVVSFLGWCTNVGDRHPIATPTVSPSK